MKKSTLNKLEKMLIDEQAVLLAKSYQDADIDIEGDETDEIQGKMIALVNSKLSLRDKEKLSRIKEALKKINNGTFGICDNCEEEISEKRLLINPGFTNCISCAEALEISFKQKRRV